MKLLTHILFISVITLAFSGAAHSATVMKTGTGEAAVVGITPEEGKLIALQRARADAIEKAAGVNVLGTTVVTEGRFVGQILMTFCRGFIIEENVTWGWSFMQDGTPKYTANTTATVMVPDKKIDPGFTLDATLNKSSFLSGESAVMTLTASKKARIAIFNLRADDKVVMVFPDKRIGCDNLIEADRPFVFPDRSKGVSLETSTLKGHKRDSEAFFIVALQPEENQNFNFTDLFANTKLYSVPEFFNLYSRVCDKTVEVIRPYEVKKNPAEQGTMN